MGDGPRTHEDRSQWVLIGVPTSAGAHHAGQDRAPAALRAAGVGVTDAGDLPGAVFAVDHLLDRYIDALVSAIAGE